MKEPDRTPRDGQPYYCETCGLGFGEFMACERPDCRLETVVEAERRKKAARKKTAKRDADPYDGGQFFDNFIDGKGR